MAGKFDVLDYDLMRIALRLERMEGPSRAMDALIHAAVFNPDLPMGADGGPSLDGRLLGNNLAQRVLDPWMDWDHFVPELVGAPHYTNCLDAGLPKEHGNVQKVERVSTRWVVTMMPLPDENLRMVSVSGTEVLARRSAALKRMAMS